MKATTEINPEIVTSELAITPAFIVDDYFVRSLEHPTSQLTFGDVVQVSFMAHGGNGGTYEIRRLLLVLTVETNKSGNFKGLVLPCLPDGNVPPANAYMILPKRCAEKIDTGEKAIEIMPEPCRRDARGPLDFDDNIPF